MSKVEISKLEELFLIKLDGLYWDAPTRGKRIKGAKAGGVNKKSGQVVVEISGKPYPVSHIVWAIKKGIWPEGRLEHINGDKLDNNLSNLRELNGKLEITEGLVRRIFKYEDGFLYWKEKPTSISQVVIGEVAGYILRNSTKHEYRYIKISGKRCKAANLIWLYHYGVMPKMLDHINHNPQDDRIENLRIVTNKENCKNQAIRKSNTSGTLGVTWSEKRNKWRARIQDNEGNRIELGHFKRKDEAIAARKTAEKMLGYHKNHGEVV